MKILRNFRRLLTGDIQGKLTSIQDELIITNNILVDRYLKDNLIDNPKYADIKRLNKYEYQTYSGNGEDGIIQEIFARIGNTNKFFVEFGVNNGLECNSLLLLLKGWKGCWLDSKVSIRTIMQKFSFLVKQERLFFKKAFITAENIEDLLSVLSVPKEFDLLSIDIDGNDYWVWKAIENYAPRVVVVEYNSIFRPDIEWVMRYTPTNQWNSTSYFGASLKSLEILGAKKGYKLVGCDFNGVSAFFVRQDLADDKFLGPFTAENHFEPPRYFLNRKVGHKRDFGNFENI